MVNMDFTYAIANLRPPRDHCIMTAANMDPSELYQNERVGVGEYEALVRENSKAHQGHHKQLDMCKLRT